MMAHQFPAARSRRSRACGHLAADVANRSGRGGSRGKLTPPKDLGALRDPEDLRQESVAVDDFIDQLGGRFSRAVTGLGFHLE